MEKMIDSTFVALKALKNTDQVADWFYIYSPPPYPC